MHETPTGEGSYPLSASSWEPAARQNRRRFLGWAGRAGLGVIGAAAGLTATAERADADGLHIGCCHASNTPSCGGAGPNYSCPAPNFKKAWTCCKSDGRVMWCAECIKPGGLNSCHQDEFKYFKCHETWASGLTC